MGIKLLILTLLFLLCGVSPVSAADITINEVLPNPSGGSPENGEFIELYSNTTIDISGWILDDKEGGTTPYTIPQGTTINNSFIIFYKSDTNIGLNNDTDEIRLFKPGESTPYDSYSYTITSSDEGISFGRIPDGTGNFFKLNSLSPGSLNAPSPTPSPSPSPSPTPAPTPTPSPATSPSPTPSAKPTIFTISNSPSEINENQSFSVSVNLSLPDNPNTKFYIKGAFKKSGSSNYFGNTKVSGNWIKNGGSYSGQFPITTDSSGKWNGSIELMPDSEDTGFSGTSDYILKIGRYTDLGSGPIWSNEINIKIKQIEINQDFPINTSAPAATPPTEENLSDDEEKDNNTSIYNPKKYNIKIASIAGISSSSAGEIKEDQTFRNNKKGNNFLIFTGGAITVSSATFLGYLLLKSKGLV